MESRDVMFVVSPSSSRLTRIGNGMSLAVLAVLCLLLSHRATAEAQGDSNGTGLTDNGHIEQLVTERIEEILKERIEEIVVVGERQESHSLVFRRLYEDPLRARIREELRQLDILEEEFAWRLETVSYSVKPERVRAGYDPRDRLRAGLMPVEFQLPLDLVQPASLIRVDF